MALISEDSKDLLQAQIVLWNQVQSCMKSVALSVALDLRIADAIHRHGGAATLSQIAGEIGVSPCKIPALRRLMRELTVAGTFTIVQLQPPSASAAPQTAAEAPAAAVYKLTTASRLLITSDDGGGSSPSLFPWLNMELSSFPDSAFSMGLAAWFRFHRHDDDDDEQQPGPCPFALRHGVTLWEMTAEHDGAMSATFNAYMAADSNFLVQVLMKDFRGIFHGVDSLVDVGGGLGGIASAVAAAFPRIQCSVLELPRVVAKAPAASSTCSISNLHLVAGDMYESILLGMTYKDMK